MPLFLRPSKAELEILNRCRLHLKVSFLSEISTCDGLMITENAWRGQRFDVPDKLLSWPHYRRLTSKEWLVWQSFLKRLVLSRGL
jgi:hypothetical protein